MQPSRRTTRWLNGAIAASSAALLAVLALEFAQPDWFEQLRGWLHSRPVAPAVPPAARLPVGPPITITPMRPQGNDSSVSPVPQPLILVRTQVGRNSREGFAQIGVNARSPQTYAAGALLANGARLTEIYDRYVVLEKAGRKARLYLQGEPQNAPVPGGSTAVSLLTVGGTASVVLAQDNSQERLTDYLRPSPVFAAGKLHGYALYAGRKAGVAFAQLGLQPGDVVTQINGSPVSSTADSLASLRTLAEGAALSVVIERAGVSQNLSLDGSVLTQAISAEASAPRASENRPTTL